ncbi:MAG: hypothetical protein GJ676_12675 [Rhodobacteraceae bacterium]|nr:hypothetical protein [Paracoccaceae bacterium]
MPVRSITLSALVAGLCVSQTLAQTATEAPTELSVELNALQDTQGACRLSFVARNTTGTSIDKAVFETVIFDASGSVVSLSLFDFRDLPADRPRVRQFDLPNRSCDSVGQVLINGANTCTVAGEHSDLCQQTLSLSSRISVELLG